MMSLLERRKQLKLACFVWAICLAFLSMQPAKNMRFFLRSEWMTSLAHMVCYGSLTFLMLLYFRFKRNIFHFHLKGWHIAALALSLSMGWGAVTEALQFFTPDRRVDIGDWAMDGVGSILGILSFYIFRRWL